MAELRKEGRIIDKEMKLFNYHFFNAAPKPQIGGIISAIDQLYIQVQGEGFVVESSDTQVEVQKPGHYIMIPKQLDEEVLHPSQYQQIQVEVIAYG